MFGLNFAEILKMKNWLLILFVVPTALVAQADFETRYFTITATSLTPIEELSVFDISFDVPKKFEKKKLSDFNKVTSNNYWQAVDMAEALSQSEKYQKAEMDLGKLQSKTFARSGTNQYGADASTSVQNFVYKEQRGLDLLDPCPPFGICSRCAPYRVGRGFQ